MIQEHWILYSVWAIFIGIVVCSVCRDLWKGRQWRHAAKRQPPFLLANRIEDTRPPLSIRNLNHYATESFELGRHWWQDHHGNPIERNTGELLMLCVSELSEAAESANDILLYSALMMCVNKLSGAMEADRKSGKKVVMDTHLTNRPMFNVELADLLIRVFAICGARNIDIDTVYREKLVYNEQRADHKWENRLKEGGKKY